MSKPAPRFDHQDPAFVADPYPVLRRLQDEAPVFWSAAMSAWIVTRYDDVRQGLRDPRLSADRIRPFVGTLKSPLKELVLPLAANLQTWAVFNDPPQHTRLRALMNKAFTSRAVEGMRPRIERIVDDLLDLIAAGGAREFDFHKLFAYPLPASVIADMLGVPRADVGKLKQWSDDLAQFVLTSRANPDKYRRAAEGMAEMTEYFSDFIRRRERDGGGDDVTAAMLNARERAERQSDDKLSHDEIVGSALLLLFAGHETTTQLLANGLLALLRHPAQLADLRRNLDDAALVRNAVEELMRYDGPSLSMVRVAGQDFDWHGAAIRKGDRIFLFISGANHDRRAFPRPEALDIRRAEAKNQIGFGFGIHFCLGAPLARLEAEIAFPKILRRFPHLALADPHPPWSELDPDPRHAGDARRRVTRRGATYKASLKGNGFRPRNRGREMTDSKERDAARRGSLLFTLHGIATDLGYLLAGLALCAMGVFYCMEVVVRYFFNAPTRWSLETITFLMLAMTFLALPHAVRAGMHIAVTLLADLYPRHAKRILFVIDLVGLALCGFIAYIAIGENLRQYRQSIETSGNIAIPKWWLSIFISYGFANSALWYIRLLLNGGAPIGPVIGLVPSAPTTGSQP